MIGIVPKQPTISELQREIKLLRAENQKLRKDIARYRKGLKHKFRNADLPYEIIHDLGNGLDREAESG